MLSEDEKQAIEIVKKIKNIKFNVTSSFYSSGTISLSIEEKEAIKTVLNLITKLQKENEKYKYLYQKALDNTVSSDRENIQLKEQIDLMARAIDNYDSQLEINTFRDKEHVKQYFKEIAERKSEE